jgi:hypothetical protein
MILFHECKFFERIPLASEKDRFHFCQNIINILTNKCAFVYEHRFPESVKTLLELFWFAENRCKS